VDQTGSSFDVERNPSSRNGGTASHDIVDPRLYIGKAGIG